MAKSWMGVHSVDSVDTENLVARLNTPHSNYINRLLVEKSLTLVKNEDNIIPIKNLETKKIACLAIGDREINTFQKTLDLYANIDFYNISYSAPISQYNELLAKLSAYNTVIAGIHNTNQTPSRKFGISIESINFIDSLSKSTNLILDVFANAYSLDFFKKSKNIKAIIMSYEDTNNAQDLSAQLIFGGIPALGKLPISASNEFQEGTGINTDKIRLKYSIPEELSINSAILDKIDSIAIHGIQEHAFPGCQILAAKDGVVFYNKSFGYHIYDDKKHPVTNSDIYDLASLTKVVSTTASLMKLYENGTFNLDEKMSCYLPYLDSTNKSDMLIKDALTHQAKLTPWIPFWWKSTIKRKQLRKDVYSTQYSSKFPIQVADSMFITKEYRDTMYKQICESELLEKKEYKYSDIGFYLFHEIVEKQTGKKLDAFVNENFYASLGAKTLGYKPLARFSKDRIVPTQNDVFFRHQLMVVLQGMLVYFQMQTIWLK